MALTTSQKCNSFRQCNISNISCRTRNSFNCTGSIFKGLFQMTLKLLTQRFNSFSIFFTELFIFVMKRFKQINSYYYIIIIIISEIVLWAQPHLSLLLLKNTTPLSLFRLHLLWHLIDKLIWLCVIIWWDILNKW